MDRDTTLNNIKQVLADFQSIGSRQLDIFKELNPGSIPRSLVNGQLIGKHNGLYMPMDDVTRRITIEPDVHTVYLLSGFWDYYKLNSQGIEQPSRQGIDRTLLELCYQHIIPYALLDDIHRRRNITISQLCDVGMILAGPSPQDLHLVPQYTADYNYWTSQLLEPVDRDKYTRLQRQGYPTHEFARAKHALWPSFYTAFNENSHRHAFPWAGETEERIQSVRNSMLRMYQHQHDFVHGSHLAAINALSAASDQRHLFASFSIATQSGYQVLHTVNQNFIPSRPVDLSALVPSVTDLIPHVARHFSRSGM